MRTIKKIFNNNILNAVDDNGEDVILVGAGIGFSTSRGDVVDESKVEREFHGTGLARSGEFRVMLEIPYPVLRATSRVSALLRDTYGLKLSPAVEVGLADHLAHALQRMEAGLPIYNSMLWETKLTYPQEFAIALHALDVIHAELGVKLPLDEAGFVTLHLANAGLVGDPERMMSVGAAMHGVIEIVERELHIVVDGSTPRNARFLTHIKFVIQRLTRNRVRSEKTNDVMEALVRDNPEAYACAVAIGDYLDAVFASDLTRDEHLYIMLHLISLRDEQP